MKNKPNRVWIELEQPSSDEEGERRAKQASRMLKRLGVPYCQAVWWWPKHKAYCFTISTAGCFVEATDNGHWYNLDYLASPH